MGKRTFALQDKENVKILPHIDKWSNFIQIQCDPMCVDYDMEHMPFAVQSKNEITACRHVHRTATSGLIWAGGF